MGSNWIVSILIFILILGVIVVSHEFGHYSVARRCGIRVNEFDIGFGPTLLRKRVGETDFCVKLLPVGGASNILPQTGQTFPFLGGLMHPQLFVIPDTRFCAFTTVVLPQEHLHAHIFDFCPDG